LEPELAVAEDLIHHLLRELGAARDVAHDFLFECGKLWRRGWRRCSLQKEQECVEGRHDEPPSISVSGKAVYSRNSRPAGYSRMSRLLIAALAVMVVAAT